MEILDTLVLAALINVRYLKCFSNLTQNYERISTVFFFIPKSRRMLGCFPPWIQQREIKNTDSLFSRCHISLLDVLLPFVLYSYIGTLMILMLCEIQHSKYVMSY